MSEMTIYYVGIVVLAALIFPSAAKTLGEFAALVSLALIGGGYAAVLADAFFGVTALWAAVLLTLLGMMVGYWSAERDIPTVEWRARGFHATVTACVFTALAFVTFITSPLTPGGPYRLVGISYAPLAPGSTYLLVGVAYTLLAAWNWVVALEMAWRVITNHDDNDDSWGRYDPDDDYGQYD